MKKIFAIALALALCASCVGASAQEGVNAIAGAATTQAFTEEEVPEEDLNTILQAGLAACSAINQQPWYFVALTNRETMNELAGGMSFGGAPFSAPEGAQKPATSAAGASAKAALGDSPLAIIIYMDESTASPNASFDCGLACQNMVIAAGALGYGTKIVSSPTMNLNGENHDAICAQLGVDPALKAVAVLLIGFTDDAVDGATGASVRNTLAEKVSFVK